MKKEKLMDSVSGCIWEEGPKKKSVFITKKEDDMLKKREAKRKATHFNKIIGELEAYIETPSEEWTEEQEDALIDMLDAVEHNIKANISNNNEEYVG